MLSYKSICQCWSLPTRVLRLFALKKEVTGGCRKLHNQELHSFHSASNIIRHTKVRYNEHTETICSNNEISGYVEQILNTIHTYGTLEGTSEISNIHHKGPLYIHKASTIFTYLRNRSYYLTIPTTLKIQYLKC